MEDLLNDLSLEYLLNTYLSSSDSESSYTNSSDDVFSIN